ncbi:PAS domain-containing sensor histidine kinase [Microvirga rosea]|uniref:PAS domain-containing sensor histidine kinase n=1 Tax=Microvirga rosea TaxID=2715425 RepID=UPI001D0B2446|nr:PAS domain-containing sensor histidine kinase [Microvirga rosea]MCB8820494.1 PAS domain-containing sensor histidine kinase [Microvirga rosea]
MTETPDRYERMLAQLAAEAGFSSLAKPEAGVLVWDLELSRLLWASPAATKLSSVFADENGHVFPDLKARPRLKILAQGLAPREGMRLERLWFDPSGLSPPVTCACRIVEVDEGQSVLVTLMIGTVPRLPARPRHARVLTPPSPEPTVGTSSLAEHPRPAKKERDLIRFIWRTDADTRFVEVSSGLAEAVGPRNSQIVGSTWAEVAQRFLDSSGDQIAEFFAKRETWSGQSVVWRTDHDRCASIDWAGMPVFGTRRELVGFRGFGLVRMGSDVEQPEEHAVATTRPDGAGEDRAGSGMEPAAASGDGRLPPDPMDPQDGLQVVAGTFLADENRPVQDTTPSEDKDVAGRRSNAASGLSNAERNAFREIARALGARFEFDASSSDEASNEAGNDAVPHQEEPRPSGPDPLTPEGDRVLDRLPIGVLVHRGEELLFLNRYLLDLTGFESLSEVVADGGLVRLFRDSPVLHGATEDTLLEITARAGKSVPVDVRLASTEWGGEPAALMTIRPLPEAEPRLLLVETDLRRREARVHELESILDTATDGVIVLDETGRIISLNRSAEALFGYDGRDVVGSAITVLLAPESHIVALDYLEGLRFSGVQSLLNDGREVQGRVRQGGTIPLFMTIGRVHDGPGRKFCAVLRDMTAFKKAEGELIGAKRAAEEASAQKSDLLAKISHEIRTPLNAILGFAEVMLEERFGAIENERYKEYLKDIHASGAHVISLVNDLLDLAKVEAGRMELAFTSVSLNELVAACVTLLQPQAARERIVMRTSFPAKLPPVVADERSMRQIVLNLVSNAIKFTDAGGQVIVSTALTDRGEIAFRVRDTGIGMTDKEVQAALEPFRQLATSRRRGGTGLGLPLTKALVEANRGALQISSSPKEGTLVEVIFPPTRVLAE